MSNFFNTEIEFTLWFNEVEGFGLRAERFFDEIKHNPSRGYDWMKAAFVAGAERAIDNRSSGSIKKVPALFKSKDSQ